MKKLKTKKTSPLNNVKSNSTGLTLVEVLVYIAVLAILIGVVSSFFVWTIRSNIKAKISREVLDTGRRIIRTINSEIKGAKNIYSPTSVFNSHPGQLSLEIVKNLPEGENKSYLDFYICQEHLCLKRESQNPVVLTSDEVKITNLVFSRIGDNLSSLKIDLKVESAENSSGRNEYQAEVELSSVVSFRLQN